MDAVFSWRKTRAADLPECLSFRPAKNGSEFVGQERVLEAWRQLLEMTDATRSAVVELKQDGNTEIVGLGLATFVTKEFVNSEMSNPAPGLNARVIASIVNNASVIATHDEVREANTRGDLQQVTLEFSWKNRLNADERNGVSLFLGRAYQALFAGYHLSRTILEAVDELDLLMVGRQPGFEIIDRFEAFRRANPDTKWNQERALVAVTTESSKVNQYSIASALYQNHIRPQFGFTQGEQQLLEAAIGAADDAEAAKSLFVSLPTIKRRWEKIFERVAAIAPDLCPQDGNGTRGTQKRQRILNYVRSHPEELRPFDLSADRKAK
jgi:hypothetical protein